MVTASGGGMEPAHPSRARPTGLVWPPGRPHPPPTKLIEIVEIGKQLLMTRGASDDLLDRERRGQVLRDHPAMFILAFPQLGVLNVMRLATPESAILSAVIFNAVIIIGLIPLALKGIPTSRSGRRPYCGATC